MAVSREQRALIGKEFVPEGNLTLEKRFWLVSRFMQEADDHSHKTANTAAESQQSEKPVSQLVEVEEIVHLHRKTLAEPEEDEDGEDADAQDGDIDVLELIPPQNQTGLAEFGTKLRALIRDGNFEAAYTLLMKQFDKMQEETSPKAWEVFLSLSDEMSDAMRLYDPDSSMADYIDFMTGRSGAHNPYDHSQRLYFSALQDRVNHAIQMAFDDMGKLAAQITLVYPHHAAAAPQNGLFARYNALAKGQSQDAQDAPAQQAVMALPTSSPAGPALAGGPGGMASGPA